MEIRSAVPEDARDIATVHIRTWQDAYRGLVPDEYLDSLDIERRIAAYAEHKVLEDAERPMVVVEHGGRIVGFAGFGPSIDEEHTGEVYSIYVSPSEWGTGAGRELMREAIVWLSARYPQATLWVLDGNARARKFYEIAGWRPDGTTKDDDRGSFVLREVRYRIRFQEG